MRVSPFQLVACVASLAAVAGAASCADSLHLDPPGTGGKDGGTTTTIHGTGGGTGGGLPTACVSNPDCAYPKPVCDMVQGKCVECLTADDCSTTKPGTVCSLGACVCPPEGATALTYCAAGEGKPNRCVDTQTSSSDCGSCGVACFGSCSAGKCADKWRPITTVGAPSPRSRHVAVWTGSKMFVWGGSTAGGPTNTGGLYDPATDTWTPVSAVNAPSARYGATAVWDDTEKLVLVWGGIGPGGYLNTGGMYDPEKNTWTSIPTGGSAPSERAEHTAVWATFTVPFQGAARGMIVWGGTNSSGHLDTGAVFDPVLKKWAGTVDDSTSPSAALVPSARGQHTAVWDSGLHQMIVWGGYGFDSSATDNHFLLNGAVWDPSVTGMSMAWGTVSIGGPQAGRAGHTAVFAVDNPSSMIVWGGYDGATFPSDGYQYKSAQWIGLGSPSPEGRQGHTAVWIDATKQMIIFGGDRGAGALLDTTWSLDSTLVWTQLPTAPTARTHHTAVVAGSTMMVWGGAAVANDSGLFDDGAIYDASGSP